MAVSETNNAFYYNYHGTATPVWANPTSITVKWIAERDQTDTVDLINSSSTTVNITATGLNGILTSSSLSGTVTVASGSLTTVTGSGTSFTSDFKAGDVIYIGTEYRTVASNPASNTSLTVSSAFNSAKAAGSAYSRGGRSNSTVYYLYAIGQAGSLNSAGLALSTRAINQGEALVDLPSGYSFYRQLPFALSTDGSANINAFQVGSGWPYRPVIYYNLGYPAISQIFSATITPSGTTFNCSGAGLVPAKVSEIAIVNCHNFDASGNSGLFIKTQSSDTKTGQITSDTPGSSALNVRLKLSPSGSLFFYMTNATSAPRVAYITGFIVTKVP